MVDRPFTKTTERQGEDGDGSVDHARAFHACYAFNIPVHGLVSTVSFVHSLKLLRVLV
jgi:hypothetical protein